MSRADWVWMPHPGHFICAKDCQFHLNTYVNGYIVSTVGEFWPERSSREIHAEVHDPNWLQRSKYLMGDSFDHAYMKRFGFEEIGYKRKYETMIFKARPATEAETSGGYHCCQWRMSGDEIECRAYNAPGDAFQGHMELCEKYETWRLTNCELFVQRLI